jgi:hypothetical protein
MKLYAQHGSGKSNKIEKGIESSNISGVILSPKAETPEKLKCFIEKIKNNYKGIDILFDPQFYICAFSGDLSEGKMGQYSYYKPGLTRSLMSKPKNLHTYVDDVLNFQEEYLGLCRMVSPTISFEDFNAKESQIALSLASESESLIMGKAETNLIISFCINENAFNNKEAMNEFLDVISLFEVKGFYIIIEKAENSSKITEYKGEVLSNIMYFCYILAEINDFEVILGYTDLLSIPLMVTGISATACGWHNTLKNFSQGNFQISTGGRPARKRYASNKLLNTILILPEMVTINKLGKLNDVMSGTSYDSLLLPMLGEAAWNQEVSCLHNWESLNILIGHINALESINQKMDYITGKIELAKRLYGELYIIPFDSKSNDSHLNKWLEAIKDFREQIGV